MSLTRYLASAYMTAARLALASVLVFFLFSGLLGWLLEPQGDRWCIYLNAERVPVLGSVDDDICIVAL